MLHSLFYFSNICLVIERLSMALEIQRKSLMFKHPAHGVKDNRLYVVDPYNNTVESSILMSIGSFVTKYHSRPTCINEIGQFIIIKLLMRFISS